MPISTIDQKGLTNPLTSVAANTVTSAAATALTLQSAGTTAVTIDTSQNVGIGTSSPTAPLTFANTVGSAGAANKIRMLDNAGSIFGFGISASALDYRADNHVFYTIASSPTERMRIDSSGNLLVGTTASFTSERATFVSAANTTVMTLRYSGATAGRYTRFACDGNNAIFIVDNNGTGQYQNYGSSSWTAISDERYKDIIEPIENATEKVASLRSVIGKLKTDPEGTRKSFLIAQDVQKVFPEAVDSNNPEKLGIAYTDIIPLLVASIKELKAELDATKAEFDAYKASHP
jgi:hypothetical protein